MALASVLHRFRISLSDIDRDIYKEIDFRVALHPSEAPHYLLTRVLAFALNHNDELEFSPSGLGDPDQPALRQMDPHGIILWIEIGNPSARKLHKASKAARTVKIYTYKDPEVLKREINENKIFNSSQLEIFCFSNEFLNRLQARLQRDNKWTLIHNAGSLMIQIGDLTEPGEVTPISI